MPKDDLKDIVKRVEALERAVLSKQASGKPVVAPTAKQESGLVGGLRVLLRGGFFKSKKNFDEIYEGLTKEGYVYTRKVTRTAIERMAKIGGPLIVLPEGGDKVYVERK
jgi:hypothetical protein